MININFAFLQKLCRLFLIHFVTAYLGLLCEFLDSEQKKNKRFTLHANRNVSIMFLPYAVLNKLLCG